ncbi:MAG: acyl-CoA desaturase [Dehalococcoidia bacterium]|nr:acyl-CoA desaturase [Dehalococcoidia bacterium]
MNVSEPLPANGDYAALRRIVRSEGLLEPQDGYYTMKLVVGLSMFAAAIAIAIAASHPGVILGAAVFAFASTQVALLSHDIIHRQAFRGKRLNIVLRHFIGNLVLGLSPSWWNNKHSQHHATPNHVDKDPDIQLPFLAFSQEQLAKRPRWLRPVIRFQAVVILLVFPLQVLSMHVTSFQHLVAQDAPRKSLQLTLLLAHFALFGWLLTALGGWLIASSFAVIYLGVFGFYNSSVFASNHKGMPVLGDDQELDFLREQVMTSRDVDGHPVTDFWYGGLNYQIEHHLFPTMPRNNLPRAREIVQQFCADRGIPYHSTTLAGAYKETLVHLHQQGTSIEI